MLEIRLKDGVFESADGESFCTSNTQGQRNPIVTTTQVRFLDWSCKIDSDGMISCRASQEYSDGIHSIRYLIFPNGMTQTTIWVPHKVSNVIRVEQVTPDNSRVASGTIFLSDGFINTRYGYYRDEKYDEFFDYYGIHTIIYGDPNGEFLIRCLQNDGREYHDRIFTDGNIHKGPSIPVYSKDEKNIGTEGWYTIEGAMWTAVKSIQSEKGVGNDTCIRFYTKEKDLSNLTKIPIFR